MTLNIPFSAGNMYLHLLKQRTIGELAATNIRCVVKSSYWLTAVAAESKGKKYHTP